MDTVLDETRMLFSPNGIFLTPKLDESVHFIHTFFGHCIRHAQSALWAHGLYAAGVPSTRCPLDRGYLSTSRLSNNNSQRTPYIFPSPYQQILVVNALHYSVSIARYQASQRPMPPRSLRSCSAGLVIGRPRGRLQPGSGALPQRTPSAVQRAS